MGILKGPTQCEDGLRWISSFFHPPTIMYREERRQKKNFNSPICQMAEPVISSYIVLLIIILTLLMKLAGCAGGVYV